MSGRHRRQVITFMACGLAVAALTLHGCAQRTVAVVDGPWPSEVGRATTASNACAVVLPGAAPAAAADSGMWLLQDDVLTPQTSLPEAYRVVRRIIPSSETPYLQGAQMLDGSVCFSRRGSDVMENDQGIEPTGEYEELVLVDAVNPARRVTVARIDGWLNSAQASENESQQAVAFEWSSSGLRALSLAVRRDNSDWREVWSSQSGYADDPLVPMAYGIVRSGEDGDQRLIVAGDRDGLPGMTSPVVAEISMTGELEPIDVTLPGEMVGIDQLNDFASNDGAGTAFRIEMDGTTPWGVMVVSPSGHVSVHPCAGRPLQVIETQTGEMAALVTDEVGTGVLSMLNLVSGEARIILKKSDAHWAGQFRSMADGTRRLVIVGTRLTSGTDRDSAVWSVSEVRLPAAGGAPRVVPIVDSWKPPNHHGGIASVDEFFNPSTGSSGPILLGLVGDHTAALAIVNTQGD